MSLSALETALAEYTVDVLTGECGRPTPDRVLRYHGVLPHDCCSDNGFLAVSWDLGWPADPFPSDIGTRAEPCTAFPVVTLVARYVVCWPGLKETYQGVVPVDDAWDAQAAMLADVGDCVARSWLRFGCAPELGDELQAALFVQTGRNRFRYRDMAPIPAQGLCAGVQWRAYAAVRTPGAVS